ncbi:MAG: thioredoxin family protein [Burkholderiaceae bacterium]|nr:thioredoxin family protein [Burkholderiaceae bacterium]
MTTAAAAAPVVQTTAADLPAALRGAKVTVVHFWSPDPRCGYCVNDDQAFDALAQTYGPEVSFRRVQWTPWRSFPKIDLDIRLQGVPNLYVFNGSQAVAVLARQIKNEAGWVKSHIDRALAGKHLPLFGTPPPATPGPHAPPPGEPTAGELQMAQQLVTGLVLNEGVQQCTDLNASQASGLTSAMRQWRKRGLVPPDSDAPLLVPKFGIAAVQQMLAEAHRQLAAALPLNNATLAGCQELQTWLLKT